MSLSRRRFIAITAFSTLTTSFAPVSQATEMVRWQGIALGAKADLRIAGMPQTDAQRLIGLARAEIERLENLFSLYRPDSDLARLNKTGRLASPKPEMLELLSIAGSVHENTGGLFDPTIQPLWQVYAEHQGRPPSAAMEGAMATIGWRHVDLKSSSISLPQGFQLTLNGIAQGYMTDKVATLLRTQGLQTGVIEVGELVAMGGHDHGQGWPVRLVSPDPNDRGMRTRLMNEAVATSAPTGMLIGAVSHIMDPRTGRPAPSRWKRVSVIHSSAAVADGLSTAGVLSGGAALSTIVASMGGRLDAVASDGSHVMT